MARSYDIADLMTSDGEYLTDQVRRKINGNFRRILQLMQTELPASEKLAIQNTVRTIAESVTNSILDERLPELEEELRDELYKYVEGEVTEAVEGLQAEITGITLETIGGVLPVSKGGTGATTADGAADNLKLVRYAVNASSTITGARIENDLRYNQRVNVWTEGAGTYGIIAEDSGISLYNGAAQKTVWAIRPNMELWSGTWSSGSITVPDAARFQTFILFLGSFDPTAGHEDSAIATRYGATGRVKVIGGGYSGSPYVITGQLGLSGSTFQWGNGIHRAFLNQGGSSTTLPVTRIVGLL